PASARNFLFRVISAIKGWQDHWPLPTCYPCLPRACEMKCDHRVCRRKKARLPVSVLVTKFCPPTTVGALATGLHSFVTSLALSSWRPAAFVGQERTSRLLARVILRAGAGVTVTTKVGPDSSWPE